MVRLAAATTLACVTALAPTGLRARPRRTTVAMTATASPSALAVGSQDLDWPNLGFEYRATRSFVH